MTTEPPVRRFHLPAAEGTRCPHCGRALRAASLTVSAQGTRTGWAHRDTPDECVAASFAPK